MENKAKLASKITSASPTGHGGATGHRTTQGDRGGRGNCCGDPNQHPHNYTSTVLQPGIFRSGGCLSLLGGMLQPIYRPGTHITRPFPGQSTRCHHAASFLAISPVAHSRNFGTTNYVTRTHIHTSHADTALGPYVRTLLRTESAPVARKKTENSLVWKGFFSSSKNKQK